MDAGPLKRKWELSFVEWLIVVAIVAVLTAVLQPIHHGEPIGSRIKLTRIDMTNLAGALNQHRLTKGAYPPGDFAAMIELLIGSHVYQTNSLEKNFRSFNEERQPVDLWLTPYRIETNSTNGLSIRSAGPNRRFGDADDLV
jgi:Tfp pilus assembly protein PilE